MLDMISIFLTLLRFDLWPKMWSLLENVPCALEKQVYSAFWWNILKMSVRSISFNVPFKTFVSLHIYEILKDGNDDPICKTAKETQMWKTVFWTLWEKVRVAWFERITLKHVYYHMWNILPVQVQCMRQGVQGWCTGMTLRDGMGRDVEGASGWRTHVHPWLIHVNVWQKPLQYCKVISFQLK